MSGNRLREIACGKSPAGNCLRKIAFGKIAFKKIAFKEIAFKEIAFGEIAFGDIAFWESPLGKSPLGNPSPGKSSLENLSLGKSILLPSDAILGRSAEELTHPSGEDTETFRCKVKRRKRLLSERDFK